MCSLGRDKCWMPLNGVDCDVNKNLETRPEAQLRLEPHTVCIVMRNLPSTEGLTVRGSVQEFNVIFRAVSIKHVAM